jgi:hypothetical protein
MITREDLVEQSVTDYIRAAIFDARGYGSDQVEILDAFRGELHEHELTKNYVAIGFNFDDEGEQAEMGSDLMRRHYTIQFLIFGKTNTWARNLANVVKFAAQHDGTIPLKDIEQPTAPVIDQLEVLGASAQRQIVPQPEPWQEFIWTTHIQVQDCYHAALV